MIHQLLLLAVIFSSNISAQSVKYAGDYGIKYETDKDEVIEYTLSLDADGTFLFHFYRNLGKANPEENYYGKGAWRADTNLILFNVVAKNDIDDTHTLNFNNTKAKIISKSPRDTSNRIIKESILFYNSEIPWVKRMNNSLGF